MKSNLHWYKGESMDEMEFQEADKNFRDLETEYQDKQDVVVDEDGDKADDVDVEMKMRMKTMNNKLREANVNF